MSMTCRELMTCESNQYGPTTTVQPGGAIMKGKSVDAIPIVNSSKLVEAIIARDLALNATGNSAASDRSWLCEVVNKFPIACWAEDDVQIAAAVMKEHHITRIPVLDEYGFLIGLVFLADIPNCLEDQMLTDDFNFEISNSGVGVDAELRRS